MLLVLLTRMVRTWKQALFLVQEDDIPVEEHDGVNMWAALTGIRLLLARASRANVRLSDCSIYR
jgi:hypothetical protein